jgi:hypothetical protein
VEAILTELESNGCVEGSRHDKCLVHALDEDCAIRDLHFLCGRRFFSEVAMELGELSRTVSGLGLEDFKSRCM